jgi:hypothetical protein
MPRKTGETSQLFRKDSHKDGEAYDRKRLNQRYLQNEEVGVKVLPLLIPRELWDDLEKLGCLLFEELNGNERTH